jgi:pyridoxamine 5'-phosphate oxidase
MSDSARHLVQKLRHEYAHAMLDISEVHPNPITQFDRWMQEALSAQVPEPHALNLATVDEHGQPHVRVVLLRYFDAQGFVFYTNYHSAKGRQIDANKKAAMNFFWQPLERQVRILGALSALPPETSDAYFATRPYESQLGAWASNQSEPIENRKVLERQLEKLRETYAPGQVPRPPHWGGYLLHPHSIEFWQGRPGRVHDRIQYIKTGDAWSTGRLSP